MLQSCTVSLEVMVGPCSQASITTFDDSPAVISIKVEAEEVPQPRSFPPIKSEPEEVSYQSAHCQTHVSYQSAHCQTHVSYQSVHCQTHVSYQSVHCQTHVSYQSAHCQTHVSYLCPLSHTSPISILSTVSHALHLCMCSVKQLQCVQWEFQFDLGLCESAVRKCACR
jgi:hypothetical protein